MESPIHFDLLMKNDKKMVLMSVLIICVLVKYVLRNFQRFIITNHFFRICMSSLCLDSLSIFRHYNFFSHCYHFQNSLSYFQTFMHCFQTYLHYFQTYDCIIFRHPLIIFRHVCIILRHLCIIFRHPFIIFRNPRYFQTAHYFRHPLFQA